MGDGAASQAPALFSCDSEGGAELSEMEMKSGWFGGGHCGCPGQLCGDACPGDRRAPVWGADVGGCACGGCRQSGDWMRPLGQWSSAFLAPGTSFVEDHFSLDQG